MTVGGTTTESVKSVSETPLGTDREPKVKKKRDYEPKEVFTEPPLFEAVFTYISYGLLLIMGHISDFLRRFGLKSSGPGYTEALKKDVSFVIISYSCNVVCLRFRASAIASKLSQWAHGCGTIASIIL